MITKTEKNTISSSVGKQKAQARPISVVFVKPSQLIRKNNVFKKPNIHSIFAQKFDFCPVVSGNVHFSGEKMVLDNRESAVLTHLCFFLL